MSFLAYSSACITKGLCGLCANLENETVFSPKTIIRYMETVRFKKWLSEGTQLSKHTRGFAVHVVCRNRAVISGYVCEVPDRSLLEICENCFPTVTSESLIRENFFPRNAKKSAICEIKLPRKFHATWYCPPII